MFHERIIEEIQYVREIGRYRITIFRYNINYGSNNIKIKINNFEKRKTRENFFLTLVISFSLFTLFDPFFNFFSLLEKFITIIRI